MISFIITGLMNLWTFIHELFFFFFFAIPLSIFLVALEGVILFHYLSLRYHFCIQSSIFSLFNL